MKKRITGLLVVLWMAVIFAFSHQVAEESSQSSQTVAYQIVSWQNQVFQLEKEEEELVAQAESMQFSLRKCAHMSEFALLAMLFFIHLECYPLRRRRAALLSWIFTVLYAATDEWHQLFISGRSGEIRDVCIDGLGGLLGLTAILLLFWLADIKKKRAGRQKEAGKESPCSNESQP